MDMLDRSAESLLSLHAFCFTDLSLVDFGPFANLRLSIANESERDLGIRDNFSARVGI